LSLSVGALLAGCGAESGPEGVVVYTSVDQIYSEPILEAFEAKTGIQVLAVYDVEAAKTTGLANRLIAERSRPQADVFWSGEFAQTIRLEREQVLAPYRSPNLEGIPAHFIDPEYHWIGFGGRARLLIINTDLVEERGEPESIFDLVAPEWPANEIGIAHPLFGTTATHAAALYAELGPDEARAYFISLRDRGVLVVDGNSVVRDMVAGGQLAFGMTDTDDACGAIQRGQPVKVVVPDQGVGELGTLVVPNTVALIAGGPNPAAGEALIDYLLSEQALKLMLESGWVQVTHRQVDAEPPCFGDLSIHAMSIPLEEIYSQLDRSQSELAEIFVR
jgi:iron(III) transport system substrate-binding protein